MRNDTTPVAERLTTETEATRYTKRTLVLSETSDRNAVYLVSATVHVVTIDVAGVLHRLSWGLLRVLASQEDPGGAADYRAIMQAADRALPSSRSGMVAALVDEARRYYRMGDVVLAEQTTRTLDDLVGRWADGRFIGGAALVRGA